MNRFQSVLTASLAVLAIFSACKKNDNKKTADDPSARTVANFAGTYSLDSLTASAFGQSANLYDSLDACQKDDEVILKTDLSAVFSDGAVKCDPSTDSTGTWRLSDNTDSIYIGANGGKIKSWDGTSLVITGTQDFNGIQATTEATFKKKMQ